MSHAQEILIKNIGIIATGEMNNPIIEAEAIHIMDGKINKIGSLSEMPDINKAMVVDANGLAICPGLIDAHIHPTFGDFVPALKAVDWMDSYVHGGITSMVSAGEISLPGFPATASGVKSLAILSKQAWENYHPCGAKVHAGAVMLARGLSAKDFEEMSREGVKLVGEVGMGGVNDPNEAKELVDLAKTYGFKIILHSGGASAYNCASFTAGDIFKIGPDVVCHLNGAPTPMTDDDVRRVIYDEHYYFDVISNGNVKKALNIVNLAKETDKLDKMMLGTNAPSIAGFAPTGLWMLMNTLCALSDLEPGQAIAMATGNVSKCYGLEQGIIREGYPADLILCDAAIGSVGKGLLETIKVGDIPGVAMVIIDGRIILTQSRNTTPPSRQPIIISR